MTIWKEASVPLVASLVSTHDGEGNVNASPKTWWTPTSYDPPRLILAVKPESDTCMNIEKTGMFALHLPPDPTLRDVTRMVLHTAKPLPYGKNELDDVGLKWGWVTHPDMDKVQFAAIHGMPMFGCMVASKLVSGDHWVYESHVVMTALPETHQQVPSVLLHRGQNRFVSLGEEYEVERY